MKSNCRLNTTATAREEGQCPACRQEQIEKYQAKVDGFRRELAAEKKIKELEKKQRENSADNLAPRQPDEPVILMFDFERPKVKPKPLADLPYNKFIRLWCYAHGNEVTDKGPIDHYFYTPVYLVETYPYDESGENHKHRQLNVQIRQELHKITLQAARAFVDKNSLRIYVDPYRVKIAMEIADYRRGAGLPQEYSDIIYHTDNQGEFLDQCSSGRKDRENAVLHSLVGLEFNRAITK